MNILAPAGNYEKLVAAVKAGANEVFFGLKGFGARRNNENLAMQEVFNGIDYAHSRGVKTLMTLNTILKDSEITGMGTHQELLESNQEYIELAKSQGILE